MDLSDLVHGMKPGQQERSGGRSGSDRKNATPSPSAQHRSRGNPSNASPSPRTCEGGSTSGGQNKKIPCDLCDRIFDAQHSYDQHNRVFHARQRQMQKEKEATFLCPFCSKAFTSPSKRTVHQNATHMGIRPFKCEVCEKCFGYKGDLTKHMASHSGIRPHVCYICGARFSRNFYVKRHIETVHEKRGKPNAKSGQEHDIQQ